MKRIVKLEIKKENHKLFVTLFETNKHQILGFEGCEHVELLKARGDNNFFFTFSLWKEEKNLHLYRESDVFKGIWAQTKKMFDGKPEAWSVDEMA